MTHRRFLALAIPNVVTNLTVPLAGLLDMAFLGHQSTVLPLAGVALATVIFDYLYWSFGFLRMSTTGLTAGAYGSDNQHEQAAVFWRALLMAVGIGGLMVVLQAPIGIAAFALLSGDEAIKTAGYGYYYARIWGSIPALGIYVCAGWLLGRQHPGYALLIATLLNSLNIALDWLFIMHWQWGAAGAGAATAIAEWCAFLTALAIIRHIWRGQLPKIPWKELYDSHAVATMLRLSGNLMLRTFCLITTFAIFTNFSAAMGGVVLAGNALLLRFLTTAAYGIDGFAFALESLAGYYHGSGQADMRKASLTMALRWSLMIVAMFVAVLWWQAPLLLDLLTIHEDVISHARTYMPYLIATISIAGFAYIYDGYFIGLARGDVLRNSMVVALTVGFMPWIIAMWVSPSVAVLWWGMICFTALRGITLFWASKRLP
ncbi:MAG: MATE family efflux transporter [Alphaproteobacteria bacterium]|nr:MATE family efflux transporter [Alphaproteobacteria bacterium]